jgi:hypothetical protein
LGDLESLIRGIFGAETAVPYALRLQPEDTMRRIVRVVDGGFETAQQLVRRLFGRGRRIDPLPLLMIPAWRAQWPVLHFDPEARRDQEAWSELANSYLGNAKDAALRSLRSAPSAQDSTQHLHADPDVRVAVVEDEGNLIAVTDRMYAFAAINELFLAVLSRAYPMRNFLVDRIRTPGTPAAVEDCLPMAVDPGTGLTELAYLLLPLLDEEHRGGIERLELERLFSQVVPGLLEACDIGPNLFGLRRLFKLLVLPGQRAPDIKCEQQRGGSERYSIPADEQALGQSMLSFRVPVNNQDRWLLPRGEHGLRYAKHTFVQLHSPAHTRNDGYWQITEVTNRGITANARHYRDAEWGLSPQYIFARSYRLQLSQDPLPVEGTADTAWYDHHRQKLILRHLHACFDRVTHGFYAIEDEMRAFSPGRVPPYAMMPYLAPRVHRRFRSVLHVEVGGRVPEAVGAVPIEHLAFTCCVLFHDVLAALFPRQAYRLAVVSPQAAQLYAKVNTGEADPLDRFVVRRYSLWEALTESQPFDPPASADAEPAYLDLFIIEDSDHDLGVVRAVRAKHPAVFARLVEYAKWAVSGAQSAPPYHAFGTDAAPAFLVIDAAAQMLEAFADQGTAE